MRLVLDTATLIAAIRSEVGASRRLLVGIEAPAYAALLGAAHGRVSVSHDTGRALGCLGVSTSEVGILLDAVTSTGEPVCLAFLRRPTLRDPDDDMVFETAVNGQADAIVTFNYRDFALASKGFGFEILSSGAAVKRLGESL